MTTRDTFKAKGRNEYQAQGYADREEYLDSLREEYGAEAVNAITSVLPASEDFDGLVTTLEDSAGMFGDE